MGAIRPGSGGGGVSALGDLSDIGTMGEDIAQADDLTDVVTAMGGAAAVRTAIVAEAARTWTAISLASATGWSDWSSAGTTAVQDTGAQTVTCTVPTAASPGTAALARSAPWSGAGVVEVKARLSSLTGPSADDHFASLVLSATSYGGYALLDVSTSGKARLRTATATLAWTTVASITGGQGWLWLVRDGASVRGYVGVGSGGAEPTAWTYLGAITDVSVLASCVDYAVLTAGSGASRASDVVAVWASTSYRTAT